MKDPIYLDYAATTPVDPRVAEKMAACLTLDGNFANPASRSHIYGWRAEEAVENARIQVAELLGADLREIVWTSGATESNNLAIKGAAFAANKSTEQKRKHIITSAIEHKAVLDCCAQLQTQGFDVSYLQPNDQGLIKAEQVQACLRDDTVLISLMHINNELGTVTDIAAIGAIARANDVLFHVDAAQSVGKLAIDVKRMSIDLLSLSAHKMYGPKGIGALYVCNQPKAVIEAQIHGGGHERGMRSGTLATHQIVGLGEAAAIAQELLVDESARIAALRDRLWLGVKGLPGIRRNGDEHSMSAGHLNICFSSLDGETLLLSLRELAVSTGSACTSASVEPSYVLKALGMSDADADSSLRLSLGRFTESTDVDRAIAHITYVYERLKQTN